MLISSRLHLISTAHNQLLLAGLQPHRAPTRPSRGCRHWALLRADLEISSCGLAACTVPRQARVGPVRPYRVARRGCRPV